MKIVKDDIWDFLNRGYCVVVTTNGYVNKTGEAVMGKGIAYQANKLFKGLAFALGKLLRDKGNHVYYFERQKLVTFPTKNNWKDKSDIKLIEQSCRELVSLLKTFSQIKVAMPKPGCGNGKLNWEEVAPMIAHYFNSFGDRVIVVDNEQGDAGQEWRGKNKENVKGRVDDKTVGPRIVNIDGSFATGL